LIAALALASAATGALSATALAQSTPYDAEVATSLALSAARPNSVAIGEPFAVESVGTAIIELGEVPDAATGLAIRTQCMQPGTVNVTLDSTWISSFSCDGEGPGGGGGAVHPAPGPGSNTLSFVSVDETGFKAWIVWVKEPTMPQKSAQQVSELADGIVFRDEYLAAFNRFVGCMSAAGYFVAAIDPTALILNYSISEDAVRSGADELCYESQFMGVDAAWQTQNEDSSETTQMLRECLVRQGIEPAEPRVDIDSQLEAAGIDPEACLVYG